MLALAAVVPVGLRIENPLLDVRLYANKAFAAASDDDRRGRGAVQRDARRSPACSSRWGYPER